MNVTKYNKGTIALFFLLLLPLFNVQSTETKPYKSPPIPIPEGDHESKLGPGPCTSPHSAVRELATYMLTGYYRPNGMVEHIASCWFDEDPNTLQTIFHSVVSWVRRKSDDGVSYETIMKNFEGHSLSDHRVRALLAVYEHLKRANLLDSKEIRILAKMLKKEEGIGTYKHDRTLPKIKVLKWTLPNKIREEFWGGCFFFTLLLFNTQLAKANGSAPDDHPDYDYNDEKFHGNLCNPNMAFRVLRRNMLRGTYNSNPRVERLSNGLFDCNPDGFESVLSQVVGSVKGDVSYGTILSYFGGHSYSDQRVRGLRVVLPYLDQDGSEIRKLARMLKKEEDFKNYKDGKTPVIIKELKKKLPKKIKEEVWGEEEEE